MCYFAIVLFLNRFSRNKFVDTNLIIIFANKNQGGLAQLARALAWQARGHRFDSGNLH